MKFTQLTALLAATMASFLMTACGGEPSVDGTDQGVQITKQTEMDLRVVAASGEAKVSISIHRNGLRAADAIRNPETDSPYDSDILVRNRLGFPFVTSGNHGMPNDPDTGKAITSERPSSVVHKEQIEDLQFAVEAVEQLRAQSEVGKQFTWELRSLYYMLDSALESADDMLDGSTVAQPTPDIRDLPPGTTPVSAAVTSEGKTDGVTGESVAVAQQAFTAPYTHKVWIRYSPLFWTAWQGDHSAIKLEIYDSLGAFVAQVSTRNHGSEATDPNMYTVWTCPSTFSGRNVVFPAFQPYANNDMALSGDAGGCNTSYGFFSGQHVCNDDSIAQYWNIKYLTSGTYPTCSDSTLRKLAPYCE